MEVQKLFLNKNNLNNLCDKLGKKLNMEDEDQYQACKVLLQAQMKHIFKQNKDNLNKAPPEKVVRKLNELAFNSCVKIYYKKIGENTNSLSQMSMDREREIYGDRRNRVTARPRSTSSSGKKSFSGVREMEDNQGNFGGYASFGNCDGGFYSASGGMGKKMLMNVNLNDEMGFGTKKDISGELERRMLERSGTYDGGPGMMMIDPMTGMPMQTSNEYRDDQYNPNTYNPNVYNSNMGYDGFSMRKQRPPEINFRLDGGVSRADRDENGNDISGLVPDGNDGDYGGGFGGYGDPMAQQWYSQQMNMGQNGYGDENIMSRMMQEQQQRGLMDDNMNNMNGGNMYQQNQNPMIQMMQMMTAMMMGNGMIPQQQQQDNEITEMVKRNAELSNSIAEKLNINPQRLRDMDADEIDDIREMVRRKKGKQRYNDSDEEEYNSEDEDESERELSKNDKINLIKELKRQKREKSKKLDKYVKNKIKQLDSEEEEDENSDDDRKYQQKKSRKDDKKQVKNEREKQIAKNNKKNKREDSDDDNVMKSDSEKDDTEIEDESEKEIVNNKKSSSNNHKNNKDKDNKEKRSLKTQTIRVVAKSEDLSDDPSDYMISFGENGEDLLENVSLISIENLKIQLQPELDKSCNELIIDGDRLVLEPDEYKITEIIDAMNKILEESQRPINISLKNGKVIIENIDNDKFEIDCSENSMGKLLGFTKESYSGKSKYISELNHAFISKPIYLYIVNISNDEPFAVIETDGNIEQKMSGSFIDCPISELKCMIVQFRNKMTSDKKDLVNFGGVHNEIEFSITCSV